MKNHQDWLHKLKISLEMKDYDVLASILDDSVEYHESPFLPPFTTRQQVIDEWKTGLRKQKDIRVESDILRVDGDECFAHWTASFMREENQINLDGIYHFRLNSENKCTYFKMWWVTKDA